MGNQKQVHYSLNNIRAENADYNLIFGERSNGKSYAVKHDVGILKYLETGKRFILIRRFKEETRATNIEQYFNDVDITKLTNGEYNTVVVYRNKIYFAFHDPETEKTKKGEYFGYVIPLYAEQHYAGSSFLDVEDMIFEEVFSRTTYLHDEPSKLENLRNTVDRKRNIVKIWMVGNTISRIFPYTNEWEIRDIMTKIKQGEIRTTTIDTGDVDKDGKPIIKKLAIEYCKAIGGGGSIGKHKSMLNSGSWQTDPQPQLPKSYNEYKRIFKIILLYQEFKFLGELLRDGRDLCWFVKPYNGEIDDKTIVISDQVKMSKYWQRDIYNTNFNNKKVNDLLKTFRETSIFYASDQCGTDFKQAIDFTIKK